MKKILILLGLAATMLMSDNIGSDRDMALSISDTRYTISGSNFKELKGFEVMFGRTSDFGKIYIAYDEVSSNVFEKPSYRVGLDTYALKHHWVNLSIGVNAGTGKLKEKPTGLEQKTLSFGLSAQSDFKFGEKIFLFARISYYKNFFLEGCDNGGNGCFKSHELKSLDNFNSRALTGGFTYNF